jgi:hypothetical protein
MSSNIIEAIISDEFIDKLFENEYFIKKLESRIKKKILQNQSDIKIYCYNDDDVLSTYDEFINLSQNETLSFFEKNDFNDYKHFILQAYQNNKLLYYHFKSSEVVNYLIYNKCKINNFFEIKSISSYASYKSISYLLIENLSNFQLSFEDIIKLIPEKYYNEAGTITLTEYYYLMKDDNSVKKSMFTSRKYDIDYYKNTKFDIAFLSNLIKSEYYSQFANPLNDLAESITKYGYPKISALHILSLFEKKDDKWYFRNRGYYSSNFTLTKISSIQATKMIKILKDLCEPDAEIDNIIEFCKGLNY